VRVHSLTFEFVESVPPTLDDATLYISIPYATAMHKCCCGCNNVVVTPLSPSEWKLTFDGDTVSLHPSVGNWRYPCGSHYWIKRNRVDWDLLDRKPTAIGRLRRWMRRKDQ